MNTEQIIRKSTLAVSINIVDKLKQIPLDDLGEKLDFLGRLVNVMFYEVKVNGAWMTTEMVGYIGREECSNDLRVVWGRKFPKPLPLCHQINSRDDGEIFTFTVNGTEYLFNKFDGSYLGRTTAETPSQSL